MLPEADRFGVEQKQSLVKVGENQANEHIDCNGAKNLFCFDRDGAVNSVERLPRNVRRSAHPEGQLDGIRDNQRSKRQQQFKYGCAAKQQKGDQRFILFPPDQEQQTRVNRRDSQSEQGIPSFGKFGREQRDMRAHEYEQREEPIILQHDIE